MSDGTFSYIGNASATAASGSISIDVSGLTFQAGDLLVACFHINLDAADPYCTNTTGAPWRDVKVGYDYGASSGISMLFKVAMADASEPTSFTFSYSASTRWGVTIHQFRPSTTAAGIVPLVDVVDFGSVASATNAVIPGITPLQDDCVVVAMGGRDNSITSTSATTDYSAAIDADTQKVFAAYDIQTTAAASGTVTFTDVGTASTGWIHASFYLKDVGTFPTLDTPTDSGGGSGSTRNMNYPGTVNAGDLLIGIATCDGTGDTVTFPTGDWATNALYGANASGHGCAVSYIIADGTETGAISITLSDSTEQFAARMIRIPAASWHGTTPPELSTVSTLGGDDWEISNALTVTGWSSDAEATTWINFKTTDGTSVTLSGYPLDFPDNRSYYNYAGAPNIAICSAEYVSASNNNREIINVWSSAISQQGFNLAIRGAAPAAVSAYPYHSIKMQRRDMKTLLTM